MAMGKRTRASSDAGADHRSAGFAGPSLLRAPEHYPRRRWVRPVRGGAVSAVLRASDGTTRPAARPVLPLAVTSTRCSWCSVRTSYRRRAVRRRCLRGRRGTGFQTRCRPTIRRGETSAKCLTRRFDRACPKRIPLRVQTSVVRKSALRSPRANVRQDDGGSRGARSHGRSGFATPEWDGAARIPNQQAEAQMMSLVLRSSSSRAVKPSHSL
jgi:hypothetical protein